MGRTACTEPQCLYKGALYQFANFRGKIIPLQNKLRLLGPTQHKFILIQIAL